MEDFNKFSIYQGSNFTYPLLDKEVNYHVFKRTNSEKYMYLRPTDLAIQYIVRPYAEFDQVIFFPYGLAVDNSVTGVWDFEMRLG